jgi:hypothetical protein
MHHRQKVNFIRAFAGIAWLIAMVPGTNAQEQDIWAVYATSKGACGSGADSKVEISQGRITGSGFDCEFNEMVPGAGSGMAAYEAACTVDGKQIAVTRELAATSDTKLLALDLGNNLDHFNVSIPGREDWIALYPCSPVPGLN